MCVGTMLFEPSALLPGTMKKGDRELLVWVTLSDHSFFTSDTAEAFELRKIKLVMRLEETEVSVALYWWPVTILIFMHMTAYLIDLPKSLICAGAPA